MDSDALTFIVDHRTPVLDDVALFLMYVGQSWASVVLVILAILLITVRNRQYSWGVGVCVAAIGAVVVAAAGKAIIDEPRPPFELALVAARGSAMPSSVAVLTAAMAVAAVRGWVEPSERGHRRAVLAAVSVVALFGGAVLYLGVHWLSDVLVGWALGIAVGLAAVPLGRWGAIGLERLLPSVFAWADRFATDP